MRFFELSVALKYLMPQRRQLSVSIISLISVLVISLVVWLIVVFFSVTHGLERNWIQKLIALTAPVRVTPTKEYYDSYYYQIDSISAESDYTAKTIGEKLAAEKIDPYDPSFDEEIPALWHQPDLTPEGELKDIVKITMNEIEKIPGILPREYEMTHGNLQLRLLREIPKSYASDTSSFQGQNQSFLHQNVYFASFDEKNDVLGKALLGVSAKDIRNLLNTVSVSSDNSRQENPNSIVRLGKEEASQKIAALFEHTGIKSLKTPKSGWEIPKQLFPEQGCFDCAVIFKGNSVAKVVIPEKSKDLSALDKCLKEGGCTSFRAKIEKIDGRLFLKSEKEQIALSDKTPIVLESGKIIPAFPAENSIGKVSRAEELVFNVNLNIQGKALKGEIPLSNLDIEQVSIALNTDAKKSSAPLWIHKVSEGLTNIRKLPSDGDMGESILLPKAFREGGVLIGDKGYISYYSPTAAALQEQRIPVFVAGFYDPGIMPLGGKLVLAGPEVISFIRLSQPQEESGLSNGINIRFDNLNRAEEIKQKLLQAFEKNGISKYWKIETFREFDFTKDIIKQLKSEKNLFTLLAIVIIIVACSNIISMLIILVNDKKNEIGILRSMGASSSSITMIFGFCGIMMGLIGSVIGIFFAVITLRYLHTIVGLLGRLQGHEMFNPAFYGEILPNEVSGNALGFVIIITVIMSCIAGIVPAIKACRIRPGDILRSD